MPTFKVKIRKTCLICKKPITIKRFRTYCSKTCRTKFHNRKHYKENYRKLLERTGAYSPKKKQCIYCKRWYVQVGSHIFQRHHQTAREYREDNKLPLKRGIVPGWYRKIKGDQAKENGTVKNLKAGKRYWYKKNDKRAKIVSGWKGRGRNAKPPDNIY